MFRALYSKFLAFMFLRGVGTAERKQMLGHISKMSEREAFEALFLPGRTLRRIASEDPRVLIQLRELLQSSNVVPPRCDESSTVLELPLKDRVRLAVFFSAVFSLIAFLLGGSFLVCLLAGFVGGLGALSVSPDSVHNQKNQWPVLWSRKEDK